MDEINDRNEGFLPEEPRKEEPIDGPTQQQPEIAARETDFFSKADDDKVINLETGIIPDASVTSNFSETSPTEFTSPLSETIDGCTQSYVSQSDAPSDGPMNSTTPLNEAAPGGISDTMPFEGEASQQKFFTEKVRGERKREKGSKFAKAIAITLVAAVTGGSCLGLFLGVGTQLAKNYIMPILLDDSEEVQSFTFSESTAYPLSASSESSGGFADLVSAVEPSVVTISSKFENVSTGSSIFGYDGSIQATGAGTGIIFHETTTNYYIVTNAHVVSGASAVTVSIGEGEDISAAYVGKDEENDIAVVSISKVDVSQANVGAIAIASFGDSDELRVGDLVLAIGNALGEGITTTNGIVSAKDKTITVEGTTLTVLQTNAAINEGNSGGPLVNMNGEVIGINTAKVSSSTTEGTGYAIPSNIVKEVVEEIMTASPRPMLGVSIKTIPSELALQYNLPQAGALVSAITAESPAEIAGLQVNDIITGIDDQSILTSEQLVEAVGNYSVGDTVAVKIIRNGSEFLTIDVTLAEFSSSTF